MNIYAGAQKLGIDHISVYGLNDKKHHQGDNHAFPVPGEEADQDRRSVGHYRTEIRNEVSYSAENSDNDSILYPDQIQRGTDKDRHDQSIDQLSADISREHGIGILNNDLAVMTGLSPADCSDHAFPVTLDSFLVKQKIDRKNDDKNGTGQQSADLSDRTRDTFAESACETGHRFSDVRQGGRHFI